jgi:hypothetical protein
MIIIFITIIIIIIITLVFSLLLTFNYLLPSLTINFMS